VSDGRSVARAIDALKRGWAVAIDGVAILPVETADDDALAAFDAAAAADLLISGTRAATLKLANQRDAAPTGPVRIARSPWIDLAGATAIADPAMDLRTPLKGPFQSVPLSPLEPAKPRCGWRACHGCCLLSSSAGWPGMRLRCPRPISWPHRDHRR
jgi:GTP cyclohydrolase II